MSRKRVYDTFLALIQGLSMEALKEMREWNRTDGGFNKPVNNMIDAEIRKREQQRAEWFEEWGGCRG